MMAQFVQTKLEKTSYLCNRKCASNFNEIKITDKKYDYVRKLFLLQPNQIIFW